MTHQDIDYRDFEADYGGDPVAPVWRTDQQSFDVPSTCPACSGDMTRTVARGMPGGSKSFWRQPEPVAPPLPTRVLLVCECGYPHPKRPPDSTERGCGAFWRVPLT
jgi:hypothetical protein